MNQTEVVKSTSTVVRQYKKFPIFDIFLENTKASRPDKVLAGESGRLGWSNWTRVRYVKGHAAYLGGARLPIRDVYAIMETFLRFKENQPLLGT